VRLVCALSAIWLAQYLSVYWRVIMSDAYRERCRCLRDLKPLIPSEIWAAADKQNPTGDNWRTVIIAVKMLRDCYYNI
jgi:hypothetical protein